MKKLTLSLVLSGTLALSNYAMADRQKALDSFVTGDRTAAYTLFLAESEQDHIAAFIVAMMKFEGIGTDQDIEGAEKLLVKAAAQNNPLALYNLGYLRSQRILPSGEHDPLGMTSLTQAAMLGQPEASIILMRIFSESKSYFAELYEPELIKNIVQNLEKSFAEGENIAGFALGVYWIMADDFGVDKTSYRKAAKYLEDSYQKGLLLSALALASIYKEGGYGLAENYTKARQYERVIEKNFEIVFQADQFFPQLLTIEDVLSSDDRAKLVLTLEKEANLGSVPAMIQMYQRYQKGKGVDKNEQKAQAYLDQLMISDSAEGYFFVGSTLQDLKQSQEAQYYMRLAARKDFLPAIRWLADASHYEWEDKKGKEQVQKYERQGAELGDDRMISLVLQRLMEEFRYAGWGDGRPEGVIAKDMQVWVQKLSEQPNITLNAALLLAGIYANGQYGFQDYVKSYEYYLKANQLDPLGERSLLALADMYRQGLGTEIDLHKAAQLYVQLVNQSNHWQALSELVYLNQITKGFEDYPDIQQAFKIDTELTKENGMLVIQDYLLDQLEEPVTKNIDRASERFAYLLGDRYQAKYEKAKADNASEQELNALKNKALAFYENAWEHSEQGTLAYAQASLTLSDNKATTIALLKRLKSLSSRSDWYDLSDVRQDTLLNSEERAEALALIVSLIQDSPDLQAWMGEFVAIEDPEAQKILQKLSDDGQMFATYYLGLYALAADKKDLGAEYLQKAANGKYLPAINKLAAQAIDQGNIAKGIEWYEKAAELKSDEALYQLAELYRERKNFKNLSDQERYQTMIGYYEQLSDPDYRWAKSNLRDTKEALAKINAMEAGLKNNDPKALYDKYFSERRNSDDDLNPQALSYLIKSADLGYEDAMKQYFDLYRENQNMTADELERFNRYHIGFAENGSDWDVRRLADRFLQGDRIPVDRDRARQLYEKALKNDPDSSASYDLGAMNQFDKNYSAAQRGTPSGMLNLARAYENGQGIQKDPVQAYEWMKKAAEANNGDAAFYYGVYHQDGVFAADGTVIVEPNWATAMQWYAKASSRFDKAIQWRKEEYETTYLPATQGDSDAMLKMGKKAWSSYQSKKYQYHLDEAKQWYEKSIQAGNSQGYLAMLETLPKDEQPKYIQSILQAKGDDQFKLNLSEILLRQKGLSDQNYQLIAQNLEAIIDRSQSDDAIKIQAMHKMLQLQEKLENSEKFKALAEKYGQKYPQFKRTLAESVIKTEPNIAVQLLKEAYEAGDYYSAIELYDFYRPDYYDQRTLAKIEQAEFWLNAYLTDAPEYKLGPNNSYNDMDLSQIMNNEQRAMYCEYMGDVWMKKGQDYMADHTKAKAWYEKSLNYHVQRSTASGLAKIADMDYRLTKDPKYIEDQYMYEAIYDEPLIDEEPFNQLSQAQIQSALKRAEKYQDMRDYGNSRWVIEQRLKGIADGQYQDAELLGDDYLYGRNTRINIDKAIEYYELAGKNGRASSYNRLGNLFRKNEHGISPDYPRAVAYFEKGAALGDSNTAHLAGDMLYFGEGGLPKNYEKALYYYDLTDLAQGDHHALAKYKQAKILYDGLAHPATLKDYQQAYDLLVLAKSYGDELAMKALDDWDFSMLPKAE